jgi:integrase
MARLEKFLRLYGKSTAKSYRAGLTQFFSTVYMGVGIEEAADRYFEELRDYKEDVRSFFASIKDSPPKTVHQKLSIVRTFLAENSVELPPKFWHDLRGKKKGTRVLMLDKVPSNVELKRILTHMDINGKALFLTLASSGMRIGEALSLKQGDVDLTVEPAKISIRGECTKTGNPRIVFISREAKEAIEEWLKTRERYIDGAVGKSHLYAKSTSDERLFPFENNTAYMVWKNALSKSGFEEKYKYGNGLERYKIHPHVLRKFFRTKMGSMIPVDVAEALMGHEGYLTESIAATAKMT